MNPLVLFSVFVGCLGFSLAIGIGYCGVRFLDAKKYLLGIAFLILAVGVVSGFLGIALEISHDAARAALIAAKS